MNREPIFLRFNTLPPHRTAQQKGAYVRGGRVHFFTKSDVAREERTIVGLVASRLPPDWTPYPCPVAVRIHLCYPYRKSERKGVVKAGAEIPNDRRPDLDNILKGCIDALVAAQLFRDDGQIARIEASKTWGPMGYWEVGVAPIDAAEPASVPQEPPNKAPQDLPGQTFFGF